MGQPLIAPMPESLDLQAGYAIRITAIDSATGNLVSGVKITTVVLTADQVVGFSGGGGGSGEWMLVPGINA